MYHSQTHKKTISCHNTRSRATIFVTFWVFRAYSWNRLLPSIFSKFLSLFVTSSMHQCHKSAAHMTSSILKLYRSADCSVYHFVYRSFFIARSSHDILVVRWYIATEYWRRFLRLQRNENYFVIRWNWKLEIILLL